MWFLYGLILWRLITPFYASMNGWCMLTFGTATGIVAHYSRKATKFGMWHAWAYFPFYLIGVYLKQFKHVDRLNAIANDRANMKIAAGVLILSQAFLFLIKEYAPGEFWAAYDQLHGNAGSFSPWYANNTGYYYFHWVFAVMNYIVETINVLCVIVLFPDSESWMSDFGSRTLVAYVFHYFFALALGWTGWYGHMIETTEGKSQFVSRCQSDHPFDCSLKLTSTYVIAIITVVALMTKTTARVLGSLIQPPLDFMFDDDEEKPTIDSSHNGKLSSPGEAVPLLRHAPHPGADPVPKFCIPPT